MTAFVWIVVFWVVGMLTIHILRVRHVNAKQRERFLVIGWFQRLMCSLFVYMDVGEEALFLRRWFLLGWSPSSPDQRPRRGLYLHCFFRSDKDRWPHDHPWPFRTLVLKGGYVEETWAVDPTTGKPGIRCYEAMSPFTTRWRAAEHLHRVHITPGRPSWSLVFTGAKCRSWGFMTDEGWIGWKDFLKVSSSLDEAA